MTFNKETLDHMGWITPDWPVPASVKACCTTRLGGSSQPPFNALNLGAHVGDHTPYVWENRQSLAKALALPQQPLWLQQVHGVQVVQVERFQQRDTCDTHDAPVADAAVSFQPGAVCAVMTADCLPVLLCDDAGQRVAAVHAGWRGLCNGILEQTITTLGIPGDRLFAWLGPAIGPQAFEVGEEVRTAFMAVDAQAEQAFQKNSVPGKWLADIYQLARQRLQTSGVTQISGGNRCTYSEPTQFFSYRREKVTGRMASLIWIDKK